MPSTPNQTCRRKVKYDMESAAAQFDRYQDEQPLKIYVCPICQFLHYAHEPVENWKPEVLKRELHRYRNTRLSKLPSWVPPGLRLQKQRDGSNTPIADLIDKQRRKPSGRTR